MEKYLIYYYNKNIMIIYTSETEQMNGYIFERKKMR